MTPSRTVTDYRNAVKKLLDATDEARTLGLVVASQGGAAALFAAEGTFAGDNADIDLDELTAAITSMEAVEGLLTAGGNAHLTNLNRMRA
jgi:hypothetical protein